jgi:hypothetical protein
MCRLLVSWLLIGWLLVGLLVWIVVSGLRIWFIRRWILICGLSRVPKIYCRAFPLLNLGWIDFDNFFTGGLSNFSGSLAIER